MFHLMDVRRWTVAIDVLPQIGVIQEEINEQNGQMIANIGIAWDVLANTLSICDQLKISVEHEIESKIADG